MRIGSVSALVLAAFAFAACEGAPSTWIIGKHSSMGSCTLEHARPLPGNDDPDAAYDAGG